MGIKKLNELFRDLGLNIFGSISIDYLKGYRLPIDASGWIYSRMSVCHKGVIFNMVDPLLVPNRKQTLEDTAKMMINFVIGLQNNGVSLVWCWDGESVPEKKDTRDERTQLRETQKQKLDEGRAFLERIPPLDRTVEQIKDFKTLLSNYNPIKSEEMAYFRNMIEDLGFPSLQAPNEGEKLASALAQEGLGIGVWSEDTDNYALGTPLTITGFSGMYQGKQMVSVVMLHKIIYELSQQLGWQLTQAHFVDLCIMLGNDFNKNMPNIGKKRAWDLFKKYGSIDAIAYYEPGKPIGVLNHIRSREIFAYEPSGYKDRPTELNHRKDIFVKNVVKVCNDYGLITAYQELVACMSTAIVPRNVQMVSASGATFTQPPTEEIKEDPALKLKNLIAQTQATIAGLSIK